MMPPAATAATTAAEVQLAGVPVPITRSGCDVSTGWPATGTGTTPAGRGGAGATGASVVAAGALVRRTGALVVLGRARVAAGWVGGLGRLLDVTAGALRLAAVDSGADIRPRTTSCVAQPTTRLATAAGATRCRAIRVIAIG